MPSSRSMDGSATFTMLKSSTTMKAATKMSASRSPCRRTAPASADSAAAAGCRVGCAGTGAGVALASVLVVGARSAGAGRTLASALPASCAALVVAATWLALLTPDSPANISCTPPRYDTERLVFDLTLPCAEGQCQIGAAPYRAPCDQRYDTDRFKCWCKLQRHGRHAYSRRRGPRPPWQAAQRGG